MSYLNIPSTLVSFSWLPRIGQDKYPLDLDGSQRFTRPKTGIDSFPYPQPTRYLNSFCPLFNDVSVITALAKVPTGPWIGNAQTGGSQTLQMINGLIKTRQ